MLSTKFLTFYVDKILYINAFYKKVRNFQK